MYTLPGWRETQLNAVVFIIWDILILMQIWRMIDLIHRAEEDVLVELENFKSHILACERS